MTQDELNAKAAMTLTEKPAKLELLLAEPIVKWQWKWPFYSKKQHYTFYLKPATLGKLQMLAERILPLNLDTDNVKIDPVKECLKCVANEAVKLAEIVAIIVTNSSKELKDPKLLEERTAFFLEHVSLTDMAFAMAMFITTIDYAGFYSVLRLKKILDFKNTNRRTTPSIVEKLKALQSGENSQD